MTPERRYVFTVAAGVAAFALALAFESRAPIVAGAAAVYAGAAYYATAHPAVVSGREHPEWNSGVLAGVSAMGTIGLVAADAPPGVALLGFGLLCFGFSSGVAYALDTEA